MAPRKALRPRVYTAVDKETDPTVKPDGFLQKVVKYIPTEIVTAYVALADLLKPTAEALKKAVDNKATESEVAKLYLPLWIAFWILLALTPLYTWFFTQEAGKPKPIFQTCVAPIAFTAWVFALSGPFTQFKDKIGIPGLASAILIIVLLIIPLVERIVVKPPPQE